MIIATYGYWKVKPVALQCLNNDETNGKHKGRTHRAKAIHRELCAKGECCKQKKLSFPIRSPCLVIQYQMGLLYYVIV